jgi:hypothetical protein
VERERERERERELNLAVGIWRMGYRLYIYSTNLLNQLTNLTIATLSSCEVISNHSSHIFPYFYFGLYFSKSPQKTLTTKKLVGKRKNQYILPSVNKRHTTKTFFTLGNIFFKKLKILCECLLWGTRQRFLCRVSYLWHSTICFFKIKKSLPSAKSWVLYKER